MAQKKIVWKRSYNDQEQAIYRSACNRFMVEEIEAPKTVRTTAYRALWRFTDRSTQYWTVCARLGEAKGMAESASR